MQVSKGGIYLYKPPTASELAVDLSDSKFVQTGSEQAGLRPYVIVSRDDLNARWEKTAIGIPFTRNLEKANSYRIKIPKGELIPVKGLGSGDGFHFVDSVALCDNIRVIDCRRIVRKIGQVSRNAEYAIELGISFVLKIS
jgi:mRNA-degrading endonuclease toxin of MazEF toxin-antitoxin module